MPISIRNAPPNSLLFISDAAGGATPEMTRGARLWSTPSCIAIGCLAFMDGETEVSLVNAADMPSKPVFEATLETPTRRVTVSTVDHKTLLSSAAPGMKTRIRIWTNHPTEPNQVLIALG